ncbi:hypothetical protein CORC01_07010 [Colletotrichum orchidophilum]|uniref:Uncharacterized protein n=1 Tax=Colletotrichum orchidophilum TaxID=1209926 RepID=A0A1G4B8K0_9PEZI|nr:uncharacterized protein CORC01_07010 [Colletotrichum orchidophilum]OHE97595.1 hypothetical protein CORC01_07010 [Colletotrichum orchidophilum]
MSSPGPSPDHGGEYTRSHAKPLDDYIPRQSQLASFQQERSQDGNILVPLSYDSRGLKSAIDHHKSRATRAIKTFQQNFTRQTSEYSGNVTTNKSSSTGVNDKSN